MRGGFSFKLKMAEPKRHQGCARWEGPSGAITMGEGYLGGSGTFPTPPGPTILPGQDHELPFAQARHAASVDAAAWVQS